MSRVALAIASHTGNGTMRAVRADTAKFTGRRTKPRSTLAVLASFASKPADLCSPDLALPR